MSLHTLEGATGSLEILVHLYLHGATAKTVLAKLLRRNHEAVGRTVQSLKRLRILEIQTERRFPYRQLVVVTTAGRELVESPLYMWPSLLWDSGSQMAGMSTGPGSEL